MEILKSTCQQSRVIIVDKQFFTARFSLGEGICSVHARRQYLSRRRENSSLFVETCSCGHITSTVKVTQGINKSFHQKER